MEFHYSLLMDSAFGFTIGIYLSLLAAVLLLWYSRRDLFWLPFVLLALIFAFIDGRVSLISLCCILGYAGLSYLAFRRKKLPAALNMFVHILWFIASVGFMYHLVPGMINWLVAGGFRLSPESLPFSLYFNMDKVLVPLFLIGFGGVHLLRTRQQWKQMWKQTWPLLIVGLPYVAIIAVLFKFITVDFTFNSLFFLWAVNNLFFVCLSEEAFFRGYVQQRLTKFLKKVRWGDWIALYIASALFGLVHWSPFFGWTYACIAGFAGLFYGWVYKRTHAIEASILAHFLVNSIHFLFFTYPAMS